MADSEMEMDGGPSGAGAPAEGESMLGMLDVLLFSIIAGLLIFWAVFRKKKKEEIPEFKKIPTHQRNRINRNVPCGSETFTQAWLFVIVSAHDGRNALCLARPGSKCVDPHPEVGRWDPGMTQVRPRAITPRETSFIEKMKKTGKNIVVFYGSQTGTAEEFSNRLSKDARRYGMRGTVADPEEYDMSELSRLSEIDNSIAVFCMATYGEGDPTDNAQDFYDWLQEADDDLSGVNFTVFGLGNKTYEHYNAMGKYVDKRLQQLGAKRIFDLGMGDDDGKEVKLSGAVSPHHSTLNPADQEPSELRADTCRAGLCLPEVSSSLTSAVEFLDEKGSWLGRGIGGRPPSLRVS
ncbi:UNVERIFIED_CONTAM: hypothetical protein FKN15_059300 [Acipenser sinensis]